MVEGPTPPVMLCGFSEKQVHAAAKAWLEWQFKGQEWETASSAMKEKFLVGSRVILLAVKNAS